MPRTLKFQGSAYGVGFSVEADSSALLEEARQRMPPGWRPGRSGRPRRHYVLTHATDGVLLTATGVSLGRGLSHLGALDVLESDLQLFVAQHSRAFVFVHAGVVGVSGKALVLPGTSGAGKTTLVQALLEAGATYYSDEYALLDVDGCVHPYPRALSVRTKGGQKVRVPVPPSVARTGTRPLPLGLVVLTEYFKGGRWRPQAPRARRAGARAPQQHRPSPGAASRGAGDPREGGSQKQRDFGVFAGQRRARQRPCCAWPTGG